MRPASSTLRIVIAEPGMFDFEKRWGEIGKQTVLCIGDLMLDDFVYGDVSRISPEAPAPVIRVSREEEIVGGAGNVARNVAGLGSRCMFVGVIGNDAGGQLLKRAFSREGRRIVSRLVVDRSRPTTRKLRFVSEHFSTHLLRADWEVARPVDARTESALIRHALALMPKAGAVVLSDYAKGVLTPRLVSAVIARAKKLRVPVIVDPKGSDYAVYRGATVITPNRKELGEATRRPVARHQDIAAAAKALARTVRSEAVLATLSEDGMMLQSVGTSVHVPAYPVKVRDVSGAGDTVVATLAVMLAAGADFESAARAANAAAAVVVGKRGTATVTVDELRTRLLPHAVLAAEEKIVGSFEALDAHVKAWRRQGLRIGFTNGVFDLLHPGHIKVLAQSRATCDRLVVGINSDASVKRLKGKDRPIQNERARAEVLAGLEAVDLVAIFEQDTPLELIRRVQPDVLVKGGDYRLDQVVGRDLVEARGGQVFVVDLVPGFSTTRIVQRSRRRR
jgi:D-beta-D-heptose 7-phosphate kinase/D-beta-D-heptose 1-phosphate adenosyltransferase